MPFVTVRAFAPLMTQRVGIRRHASYGTNGDPTYGTLTQYQCAVVGDMKLVRNAAGQEVPSRQAVYLMSNAAIRPEDQVVLSTGDVGSTESYAISPPIIAVGRYPFTRGQFATVLYL